MTARHWAWVTSVIPTLNGAIRTRWTVSAPHPKLISIFSPNVSLNPGHASLIHQELASRDGDDRE
jgi:hypothetical protein